MHAYLIVGTSKESIELQKQHILETYELKELTFKPHKIADVREVIHLAAQAFNNTAFILEDMQFASVEAQNALLKMLEEPTSDLTFILTTNNLHTILPTVRSRCSIIVASIDSVIENSEMIETFLSADIGERLQIVSSLTKREDAITFIQSLQVILTKTMSENMANAALADASLKAAYALAKNANPSLTLTNMVLKIS
ncbi:hypothetical protein A2801_02880 [Candidatus Woesebacteria bacterium RIFCSPHIGHO2_01_FULL_41_10]|uniref:DNA polymerase III subunit delta n=1 Tax=Candidatus Woesebacteria bacterium RIFCSPHIGHO2_01_FULL_41_10 TaxID=1802500 RepID=A0A1F7YNG1_9BACT|nr:MAG: hypothetical protein A2801_02880 [Candidatus Woesebacteria bacterium RIFCSPHIGHO2_01_FULL_41_10]